MATPALPGALGGGGGAGPAATSGSLGVRRGAGTPLGGGRANGDGVERGGCAATCRHGAYGGRCPEGWPARSSGSAGRGRLWPTILAIVWEGQGRKAQPPGVAVGGRCDRNGRLRFFGGAAAPGGLRLPPPSLRSWKNTKKAKQQSTCEWQRVGGIPEVQGVSEVTRYARIGNLVAWRRRAAKNCCLPLLWVNKRPKENSNNNQPVGCEV